MVIPDQVGEWFHLIPAGTFLGRDGRGPYTLADPERVLAEFAARGADLCVDYDHQSLSAAEKQGPVPASGWIKALESREDGIWGRIDWTERAQAHLAAKEYRYLSPVFSFNPQTGEVVRLDGAAPSRQGASMEEFLEQLRWLLNLPVGATADDIKAHLEKIKQQIEAGQTAGEAMSKLLGLPAGTALAEIATAVQARVGQAPDPAQWVPKAEYERVANALAQNTADQKAARVDQVVRAAMAAAKISPALEGWARDYANRDLEAFNAYVAKTPAIVADAHGKNPPQGDGLPTLTADQEAVARACGLSREAFARTLAGKE
jgi:phage I-like protein